MSNQIGFLVFHWYVLGMVGIPKTDFSCVIEVCFRYFQNGMFWELFRYINFVPKMILNGILLVCLR